MLKNKFIFNEDEITAEVAKPVKCAPETVAHVPISEWHRDNMIEATANMPWCKGVTIKKNVVDKKVVALIDAIDSIGLPALPFDKPFRLPL